MKKMRHNKIICLLAIFFGVFLYTPNIYAEEIGCTYQTSKSKILINIDTSNYSTSNKVMGLNSNGEEAWEKPVSTIQNWTALTNTIKEYRLTGEAICPNYVFYVRCNTNTAQSNSTFNVELYAYYQKATAVKRRKEVNRCKNGGNLVSKKSSVIGLEGTTGYEKQGGSRDQSQDNTFGNKNNSEANKKTSSDTSSNLVGDASDELTCTELLGNGDENSTMWLIQRIFDYIKVLGPILVIILSSIDFTKTVLSGDEESMKKSQSNLLIRLLCAVGIYLLPTIITILINLVLNVDDPLCGIK